MTDLNQIADSLASIDKRLAVVESNSKGANARSDKIVADIDNKFKLLFQHYDRRHTEMQACKTGIMDEIRDNFVSSDELIITKLETQKMCSADVAKLKRNFLERHESLESKISENKNRHRIYTYMGLTALAVVQAFVFIHDKGFLDK